MLNLFLRRSKVPFVNTPPDGFHLEALMRTAPVFTLHFGVATNQDGISGSSGAHAGIWRVLARGSILMQVVSSAVHAIAVDSSVPAARDFEAMAMRDRARDAMLAHGKVVGGLDALSQLIGGQVDQKGRILHRWSHGCVEIEIEPV